MTEREIITAEPPAHLRNRRMSDEEKVLVLFNALADHQPRTRRELQEITGLSAVQFRSAWFNLKRTLNGLCVVKPAREKSTYLIAESGDEDSALAYQMWQARRILKEMSGLQATITQMRDHDTKHGGFGRGPLTAAKLGLRQAQESMKTLIYSVGGELRMADDHLLEIVDEAMV